MKRITLFTILLLASVFCHARTDGDGVSLDKLTSVISEFSRREGFDVVKVGRIGTAALRSLVKIGMTGEDDTESKAAMEIFKGVKKIAIVDFGDCSGSDKEAFKRKVEKILKDDCLIMEAKDGSDLMRIYGVVDDQTDKLKNFVLYTPSDNALICIFGSISLNKVTSLVGQ